MPAQTATKENYERANNNQCGTLEQERYAMMSSLFAWQTESIQMILKAEKPGCL